MIEMLDKIDTTLEEINYWATWWTKSGDPKQMPLEKALEEIGTGRAKVLAPNMIVLLEPLKPVRMRVLERDNYICYFCGDFGNTLEHLQPVSKGGRTTMDNCVCACRTCNQHKKNMTENEYWRYLTQEYKRQRAIEKVIENNKRKW